MRDALNSPGQPYRPGNREDFDRLYRDSYPRLFRTLYGVLGDPAAAEDCVQECFLKALQVWANWRPNAPAEAWLHRIAINLAVSHRRKERLREVSELVRRLGRPPAGPDPGQEAERSDLVDALRRLPAAQAAAIVLRHYHGYNNRELAIALGVSERTIGSRLALARTALQARLGPAWGDLPTSRSSDVGHTGRSKLRDV
jgi:RNA polymerase sigma-70 factor, ECF subfamily